MPMSSSYSYVLSEAASEYAFRLPSAEQMRLARILRSLANTPNRPGDYLTTGDDGRIMQNLLVEDWVVTFWADHAVKELRVAEVTQV
jgi:hypothetical protein